ncbi:MAG: porin [Methylococcaceae bacterium]|nr:porin [Methylococcaceae bacterium]
MQLSKLTLAITAAIGVSLSSQAFAINLYMDVKTKQIYAEPGPRRELLGSFSKDGDVHARKANPESPATAPENTEIAAIREDLELKTNEIKALEEHAKEASEFKVKLDDGIEFKSADGNFKAAINGRMQVDSQTNVVNEVNPAAVNTAVCTPPGCPTNNELGDGAGIRRARLGVEGTFFKDFDYKFEYDFTRGNGTIGAGVTDAYMRWNLNKPFSVKVGAFKEPFSLEEATSNRYISFIERNMVVNAFVDNLNTYKVGVGANYAADRWNLSTSFQTEPVGANPSGSSSSASSINTNGGSNRNNGSGDTGWEVNGRLAGTPWMESKTKFLHVGASGSYINVNNNYQPNGDFNNGGFSFTSATGANVDRTNELNTGQLTSGKLGAAGSRQLNHWTRFGAETALVYGPFSAQAEYIQADLYGTGYNGESMKGYYGYMSYFLTGESRAYKTKTAAWDRLKPNHNFDMKGGWGAWEVVAGYDYLDMTDGVIKGGRADVARFGINWYPNSHVRVMTNLVHALNLNTAQRGFNNADLDMFETRVQLDW